MRLEKGISLMKNSAVDPADFLRKLGQSGDGPHDIARAALMLAVLDHAGRRLEPYEAHLAEISDSARHEVRSTDRAEETARVLSAIIVGRCGYDGDRITYDDPKNSDLISVIDRRRGMPVALGILYIHAARAAGMKAAGLNTPAHFLLRIETSENQVLIDPFNGGACLETEQLMAHPTIRSPSPGDARLARLVSDVDVLLRLQNNLKLRALGAGDRKRGLEIAKRMVLIAPRKPELWIDLAHLNEIAGTLGAAKQAYDACLSLAKPGNPLHNEAALGLHGLKRRLN